MDSDNSARSALTRRALLTTAAATPLSLTGVAAASAGTRTGPSAWTTTLDAEEELVAVAASAGLTFARTSSTLYGVEASSGTVRFTRPVPDGFQYLSHGDGRAYLLADGVVHAVSLADGSDRWTFDLPFSTYPYTAAGEDALFVGAGDLFALSHEDGGVEWRTDGDRPGHPVGVHDSVLATTDAGSGPGSTYDAATGDHLAAFDAPAHFESFGLAGGHYVGTADGELRLWDARTGERAWTTSEYSYLDYGGGALFVTSADGLHRVDTDDWTVAWTLPDQRGGILAGVRDGVAYVRQREGAVAVGLDGDVKWAFGTGQYPALVPLESGAFYRDARNLVRLDAQGRVVFSGTPSLPPRGRSYALTDVAGDHLVVGTEGATLRGFPTAMEPYRATQTTTATRQSTTAATETTATTSTTDASSGSGASVPGFGLGAAALSVGAVAVRALTRSD